MGSLRPAASVTGWRCAEADCGARGGLHGNRVSVSPGGIRKHRSGGVPTGPRLPFEPQPSCNPNTGLKRPERWDVKIPAEASGHFSV